MPAWVQQGYQEYARRLPRECSLCLREISLGRRGKGADMQRAVRDEGVRMLAALPRVCRAIALDQRGRTWSTEELAGQLEGWLAGRQDLALLVGGPDGLAESCLERANALWSLSPLTLPHPLVRILVAEQLYRAWSILSNHPYHRG